MSPMLENDPGLAVRGVSTTFNQVVLCPLRLPFSLPSIFLFVCLSVCQKSRRFKSKREGTDYSNRPIKLAGKVIIQDISCLLPVHKVLGENYM